MKKFILLMATIAIAWGAYAQKGEISALGNLGYQSDFKRFALGVQGRYNLIDHFRVAPDVTFFFPKDKVTGLDVNLNLQYVFDLKEDRLSFYPLAGLGMQNNHYGKQDVIVNNQVVKADSYSDTNFAFNLGAGLTYDLDRKSFLNVEGKFMFGKDDCAVFLIGYGYKF